MPHKKRKKGSKQQRKRGIPKIDLRGLLKQFPLTTDGPRDMRWRIKASG